MSIPFVSICICTYERPAVVLRDCLTSLASQVYPSDRFEVLVLDGNYKSLREKIDISILTIAIKWIHLKQPGTMPIVRRMAIEHSASELVAFIDDDCVAEDGWLATLVREMCRNQRFGALQGKILPYNTGTWLERFADFDRSQQSPTYKNDEIANVSTCNCILRSKAIDDTYLYLNGYRRLESQGLFFAFEDFLLSQAILKSGYMLAYSADAIVWHRHPSTLGAKLKQFNRYGRGAYAYCFVSGTQSNSGLPGYTLPHTANGASLIWLWIKAISRVAKKYPSALRHTSPWFQRVTYPFLCWLIQGAYYIGFWTAHRDIARRSISS